MRFEAASLLPVLLLLAVTAQRLGELIYARHNTQRLIAAGAQEVGAGHYPFLVLLHASWLAVLWYFAVRGAAVWHPWPTIAYFLLQGFRLWIMVSLGRFWTTRILILSSATLVRQGPYRYCRHPNYLLVVLEIAVLPLALGLWPVALAFSVANALLLAWRMRVEESALAPRRYRVGL